MRTRWIAAVAGAAAIVLASGLALGWFHGRAPVTAPPQPLAATASLSPHTLRFGDPLGARIDVLVDPKEADPASVRLRPRFAPYTIVATDVETSSAGGILLSYRYTLECLSAACVPGRAPSDRRFLPAHLSYRTPAGRLERRTIEWPGFTVASRLTAADLGDPTARLRTDAPVPAVTYRIAPGTLRTLLAALSAVLVLAAAALVALALPARRRHDGRRRPPADPAGAAARQGEHRERLSGRTAESARAPGARAPGLRARRPRRRRRPPRLVGAAAVTGGRGRVRGAGRERAVRRRGIPLSDVAALGRARRRTLIARTVLAAGLAGALAAAYLAVHHTRKGGTLLPSGRSPVVAIDMSWSVSYVNYRQIERTLTDLADSGRRIGLVLFSDVAYEALPPGTAASELRQYLRFFAKRGTSNPWTDAFAGGTRIATALDLARRILKRDRIGNGSVVLISDLADAPNDRAQLAQTLVAYAHDSIPIKIVGLDPAREDAQLFQGALAHGGGSVTTLGAALRDAGGRRSSPAFPIGVVAAVATLALLLGLNEQALGSLGWRRRRGA